MLNNIDDVLDKEEHMEVDNTALDNTDCSFQNKASQEEKYTPTTQQNNNQHYSMVMGDKPVGYFERMFDLITKHGIFKSVGIILLIMVCVMIWQFINALNYDKIAERIVSDLVEKQTQEQLEAKDKHLQGSALRLRNNGKIQKVLMQLLFDTNADRVSILEMHNGKENPSLLPFVYCDMTYEETKDRTPYIADEYEQLNMGKYPFFTHLINERVVVCDVEDIIKYDKKFYSKLVSNDTKYIAMLVIKNDIDVGFLVVSFMSKPDIDQHQLLIKLNDCAQQLGILLDLSPNDNDINK